MKFQELYEYREREPLIGGDPKEVLPPYKIKEIRVNIRAGATDLTQNWKSAVELVHKAYEISGCAVPLPSAVDGWTDYRGMLELAVNVLAKTRGPYAKWRLSAKPSEPDDAGPKSE